MLLMHSGAHTQPGPGAAGCGQDPQDWPEEVHSYPQVRLRRYRGGGASVSDPDVSDSGQWIPSYISEEYRVSGAYF